jgi:hypothetical protein
LFEEIVMEREGVLDGGDRYGAPLPFTLAPVRTKKATSSGR